MGVPTASIRRASIVVEGKFKRCLWRSSFGRVTDPENERADDSREDDRHGDHQDDSNNGRYSCLIRCERVAAV